MSETSTRPVHGDFPCIDGLRAVAALAVVLCHTTGVTSLITSTPGAYLAGLRAGVQVFFVISGFVLYRPFAQAHLAGLRGPRLGGYFRRRFLRIFPAYWVVLAVGVYGLGVLLMYGSQATITNFLLVQLYFPANFSGLGPAWTLVIEVTFYVFLPFYALVIWRLGHRRPLTAELAGCGALLVAGLAFSVWWASGGAPLAVGVLPSNLVPFALGMTLAATRTAIKPESKAWYWSERAVGTPWKAWLLAAIAFSATVWAVHYPAVLPLKWLPVGTQINYQLLIDVMAFFVVLPAVFGNQRRGTGRRVLRAAPIVFLGTISYGIYLWHFPLLNETRLLLYGNQNSPLQSDNFFEITAILLVFTVAVATVSWFVLEKPLIHFSHRPRILPETIGKWKRAVFRQRSAEVSEEPLTSIESATAD